jgi:hypothetical protein
MKSVQLELASMATWTELLKIGFVKLFPNFVREIAMYPNRYSNIKIGAYSFSITQLLTLNVPQPVGSRVSARVSNMQDRYTFYRMWRLHGICSA